MESHKVFTPTSSYSEKNNTPATDKKEISFNDMILKYGVFHYFSDYVTNGTSTFYVVPTGYTFFIIQANCVGFGVASGILNGIAITTTPVPVYSSDFLLWCSHFPNLSTSNSANYTPPIRLGGGSELVNVAVGVNTSCVASVSGYLIDNSFLI